MARLLPLRRLGHVERPINGRATDLDRPCNGGDPQVLGMQPLDLVVQVHPSGVTRLANHGRSER